MKLIALNVILSIIFNRGLTRASDSESHTLEQLQVLFRHGDRAADEREIYKNDPYDSLFKEIGYGQLTKKGMRRMYETGQALRERYGTFLGDYKSEDVFAYSSYFDRVKMSLELMLAGLYPPSWKNSWNEEIHWQPIPINYDPVGTNYLTTFMCSIHEELVEEAKRAPQILARLEEYSDFYKYLSETLNITMEDNFYPLHLHNNLLAAVSLGLPLPDWCSKEDYKKLSEINAIYYDVLILREPMKRILTGFLVERLLENLEDESRGQGRKLYLHGGHDFNIVSFTRAHNISGVPDIPYYGSALVAEKLRSSDNGAYVRFYMLTGDTKTWIPLKLEYCDELCPLSEYRELVESFLPDDFARRCTAGQCQISRA